MNVLWLAHAVPYPPKAGFLLRSYNLLKELGGHHKVDLIAFIQEPWIKTLFPTMEQGLRESHTALAEFCNSVTFLPITNVARTNGKQVTALKALISGRSYTESWLLDSKARAAIDAQMRSKHYDIIHFDTIGLAPYRNLAKSTATTLMHHNIESHMMLRRAENSKNLLVRSYFRHEGNLIERLERNTAPLFDAHITCSELDNDRLTNLIPGIKPVAIPNGVDCDFFKSKAVLQRPNSLVFVGTMNWYPNIDAMIFFLKEIWPLLKQKIPTLTLDIAGSNPPASLIELAKPLDGVKVHGYVDDVRPLIDSSAIFVCPIRDGGGTKLKILDAFAMHKCVVAHPIACEGIKVSPGKDVIYATEPEEYVEQISQLLNDDLRRNSIGSSARELVEQQYSFKAIGAEFTRTLENVAQNYQAHN